MWGVDIEQVLPHVLEHIDTTPLGPRGVAMLELLYKLQGGRPNPVLLGPAKIARLTGRSLDQAKYDTKALERLRGLGLVRRSPGRGRTARGWSLNELRYWRVRWFGRRDQWLAYFSGLKQGELIRLWGEQAGQGLVSWGGDPRKSDPLRGGPSVDDRPATESERPTNELAERQSAGSSPHNGASGPDETLCLLVPSSSKKKPSSSSHQEEEQLRQATSSLAAAIAMTIGKPGLYNRPLRLVEELVDTYPDRLDELRALVPSLKGIFGPVEAVTALAQRAHALAAGGWAPMAAPAISEAAALRTKIENWRRAGEDVSELEAQLEQLETAS